MIDDSVNEKDVIRWKKLSIIVNYIIDVWTMWLYLLGHETLESEVKLEKIALKWSISVFR